MADGNQPTKGAALSIEEIKKSGSKQDQDSGICRNPDRETFIPLLFVPGGVYTKQIQYNHLPVYDLLKQDPLQP